MEEVEGLGAAAATDEEVERPHADLLVGPHVSDILKPDVYLSGSKAFVLYVNSRINVRCNHPRSLVAFSGRGLAQSVCLRQGMWPGSLQCGVQRILGCVQELEKRQAGVLNQLASGESHEAPSSEVVRQVHQAAVKVLFGEDSAEDDGQTLQKDEDLKVANSDQLVTNGEVEHVREDESRPPESPAAGSKHETGEEKAVGVNGAQSTELGKAGADAPVPAGVRRKRSIVVQVSNAEASGKNHLKRESLGAKKQSNAAPGKRDQRNTAVPPNGTKKAAVQGGAFRKLQESWENRLCGIDVDRKNDIFIAWSDHIHACDREEEAMQEGNEESPR